MLPGVMTFSVVFLFFISQEQHAHIIYYFNKKKKKNKILAQTLPVTIIRIIKLFYLFSDFRNNH